MRAFLPLSTLLMAFGFAPEPEPIAPPPQGQVVTTVMRIQRVTIREAGPSSLTDAPSRSSRPEPEVTWTEKHADRCVALKSISAAAINRSDSVDFLMTDGKRVRARLGSDCRALSFYSGIYLKPARDGKMCAERDWIRSRSGGQCQIEGFRTLVASR